MRPMELLEYKQFHSGNLYSYLTYKDDSKTHSVADKV